MTIDNTLYDSQAKPGSAGAACAVATDKRLQQMFQLFRFNARAVVFHLEPAALQLTAAADFDPAVAVTRRIHHHIHRCTLDRQRMHIHHQFARRQSGFNHPLIATLGSHHFAQNAIQIADFCLHLLAGAQIINKLLNDVVALFNIFIDRLRQVAVFGTHHLGRQTDTRQWRTQVVAHPGHQQCAVVRQLLDARRHLIKGPRYRTDFRCAILTQRRWNDALAHLQSGMLKLHQRAVLNTDKQPGATYGQQHNRQGIAEQRREIALVNFSQWNTHPDIRLQPGFQPHHR
ncbi:hypothetical protein D3C80_581220 [compost metagenome]